MDASSDFNMTNAGEVDTFWGHLTAGIFLSAFGSFFLGLTMVRLCRLQDNLSGSDNEVNDILLTNFLRQHVPEQSASLLYKTSITLIASTIFGFLYEGLGARYLNHDLHPDYTFFHYASHLTLTLLYLFAGWTGLLEVWSYLPRDSIRGSIMFAMMGEALLWYDHAVSKNNAVDGQVHFFLFLISLLTAMSIAISMYLSGAPSTMAFLAYIFGFLGILWQGLWFFVVAIHQKFSITSTSHVTVYFVLQAMCLGLLIQFAAIFFVRRTRRSTEKFKEYSHILRNPTSACGSDFDDETNGTNEVLP